MALVFLGLGTNLGNKKLNLIRAVQMIGLEVGDIFNISSFYRSEPWGYESENEFLNAVVLIYTQLAPLDLLEKTKEIERNFGRDEKTNTSYSDRLIDIDILFYENQIIDLPQLKIPHKYLHKRDFVMMPLCEIAPKLIHPELNKSIEELSELIENKTEKLIDET
ncbi:MAG: 2-amino-4-hydroxy-6-hydroxymethyldihydropteridine diphosphokinase [Porphyromonadaceae bacterium]|jgi:2-amino-4-hydroxy-6-hydroxymethyldihydropteridine diphosphokinase|nr:2-amino-4-hydroxy-6-hydroxymethyldihydropteridine diphosphokinase [Porphyromonadaceae bacterium]